MPSRERLEVCFVAGVIGSGGAERQLFYTLKTLHEHGVGVRLLYMADHNWSSRFGALGVPVACLGETASRAARLMRIVSSLRQRPPHIVQSWHFYTNLYAVAAARIVRAAEIGAVRSDAINDVESLGRLGSISLRLPRLVAANSRAAIANAIDLGALAERLRLLPNVVDTDAFVPSARTAPPGPVRLLLVGGLAPVKRADRFLSVLARVRSRARHAVKGLIVGHDLQHRWPLLQQQADRLGLLPDGVEYRGAVQDMAAAYRDAHAVVLTSDREGTPNAVMEAMAAGLPVVTTRVGGVPDLVRHGRSGFVVDTADEDGMVDALVKLVNEPALRGAIGETARADIQATHSLPRLFGSLTDLYETALRQRAIEMPLSHLHASSRSEC
jgi:glycosyltransferase involved in cell wall biosynthesis